MENSLKNLLNLWKSISGYLVKPTWFLWLKAIMRFWVNTANQSSAHGPIDFASILISFGKIHLLAPWVCLK